MWPSNDTIYILILGLLPLAYILKLVIKNGYSELSSLRFSAVLFIWIGYHLSPWVSYFTEEIWDSFLLVEDNIDTALVFSGMGMIAFLIGYSLYFTKKIELIRKNQKIFEVLPNVRQDFLIFVSFIVLVVTVATAGGLKEFWSSELIRGYGQFDTRNFEGSVLQIFTVLQLPLQLILTLMGSVSIIKAKGSVKKISLGIIALLISSLSSMWGFSRAAGFPLIILAFLMIKFKGRRQLYAPALIIVLAAYLGSVGLNMRGNFSPGISNYFSAILLFEASSPKGENSKSLEIVNPLDATPAFTRKASMREVESPDVLILGPKFVWNLNPFPSEIVPIYTLGEGLADVMGTIGSTGITTPSFAETYYVFGIYGVFIIWLIGVAIGWIEKNAIIKPKLINIIAVALTFVVIPIGLHSSMRASTRPLVYAIFILTIYKYVKIKNFSRKISK
jgi:hypothetical protein